MSTINEVIREFRMSDAVMFQQSRRVYDAFVTDRVAFEDYNIKFKEPYGAEWLTALDTATVAAPHTAVKGELKGKTVVVVDWMEECRNFFQLMKPFIEDAFPNQPAVWDEFGFDDYMRVRYSQPEMITFMGNLHAKAVEHSTKLIESNFTQQKIDRIGELHQSLLTADSTQESFKDSSEEGTEERVNKMNAAWRKTREVARIGKLLFKSSPAKYEKYVIYGADGEEEKEETPVTPPVP
ncbi:MAG: hypothetical protein HY960_08765 [Ignavibacteriae bacterium]|nr:hypothetical protein [Ignavibacteriota bacterium]